MKNIVYRISKGNFITRNLVKKIEAKLNILYPSNKSSIIKRTDKYLCRLYISGILCFLLLWMFAEISLYYSVITGIVIYVIFQEKINDDFYKLEYKLLKELLKFVEDIKFKFQFDGMLEQAIIDAINDADFEMSVHGQKIYECLMEAYYHEKQEYIDISPNHFFLTFYSLCETVMLYGDKKGNDGSLFLKNLGYLKEEINIELLKRSKTNGNFIGLKAISIIPLFFIKPIEVWAKFNIPELASSYDGQLGIITTIVLGFISIFSYKVVNIMKYGSAKKSPSLLIKRLAKNKYIDKFVRAYISFNIKSMSKVNELLEEIAYEYSIVEYTIYRFIVAMVTFFISVAVFITVLDIDGGRLYGISFLLATTLSIFTYSLSVFVLKMKKQILLLEREEEIVRFQNIILMMMHMDKITIEQILSEMERFARVFKKILGMIMDKYTYKGKEVFIEAKESSGFRPFQRLMDGFVACDDTYIYQAFDDLEKDRRYFLDRHRQENERIVDDKTTIAKTISFLPLCAVISFKLIIPFIMQGLSSLGMTEFNI